MRLLIYVAIFLCLGLNQTFAVEVELQGNKVDVPVCGGIAGIPCKDDQWCDYPSSHICGGVDAFGVCRPRPEICTEDYTPVCGCNDQTYSNACMAAMDGMDVAYPGGCRSTKDE